MQLNKGNFSSYFVSTLNICIITRHKKGNNAVLYSSVLFKQKYLVLNGPSSLLMC